MVVNAIEKNIVKKGKNHYYYKAPNSIDILNVIAIKSMTPVPRITKFKDRKFDIVNNSLRFRSFSQYFRTLNTRVSLVYIESWQSADQADIERKQDITRAIQKFSDYTARKLFKIEKDTTQLLT